AAYGDKADRIGFVRLESGVASDDLRAMHEGAEAFAQILAQRNLYVLEELAHEAAPRVSADLASEATVAPPIPHAEGQGLVPTRNGLHTSDAWRPIDG
ncbi:hypothetical protein K2Z83_28400, partial [Oscillochloris sp. ZM17-4]|uniref:hypothetical protein n=1 Tax=Oscillochloris sp. ZM17-4 TaxID=2866714 RepID=UPI001C72CD1E